MDEDKAILMDLPTSVRGFCYHDDDGEPYVILNARLSHEQNLQTYDHEKRHIRKGDMNEPNYHEYGGEAI